MRKLTKEQARAVWDALSEPVDEAMMGNMHLNDVWAEMELRLAAITAKPGEKEFCWPTRPLESYYTGRCTWWFYREASEDNPMVCCHPDFDGKTCPTGRWEVDDDETKEAD